MVGFFEPAGNGIWRQRDREHRIVGVHLSTTKPNKERLAAELREVIPIGAEKPPGEPTQLHLF